MLIFVLHICIWSIIMGLLALWFKFFLRLKATLDFSYIWIVIVAAYSSSLAQLHRWRAWPWATLFAIFLSLFFSVLIVRLASKLSEIYFAIGSLAIYMICFQLSQNLESLTGGALGLSGLPRALTHTISLHSLWSFLVFILIIGFCAILLLRRFLRSYFYTVLQWWWERHLVVQSLGAHSNPYLFVMLFITTLLASLWWSLFAFYFSYIDPNSFGIALVMLLLIIAFLAYNTGVWATFLVSFGVSFIYEFLRFVKIVTPSALGYTREMFLDVFIILAVLFVFTRIRFIRGQ